MTTQLARLLEEALRLPAEARGALAGRLLNSLDGEVDPDAEEAWDAEIASRPREIESGTAKMAPWSEVHKALQGT